MWLTRNDYQGLSRIAETCFEVGVGGSATCGQWCNTIVHESPSEDGPDSEPQ